RDEPLAGRIGVHVRARPPRSAPAQVPLDDVVERPADPAAAPLARDRDPEAALAHRRDRPFEAGPGGAHDLAVRLRHPLPPLLALEPAARPVPDPFRRLELVLVHGEVECRDSGRILPPQLTDHGAASHPSSGRTSRPSSTSRSRRSPSQYQRHENHRGTSFSGASTAARTPATTRSASPPWPAGSGTS